MKTNLAIILAGGSGTRASGTLPKQFLELSGKTVLAHTLECFEKHPRIDHIVVISNPHFIERTRAVIAAADFRKVLDVLPGGKTRQESSYIGVTAAGEGYENLLIHDAARPFVTSALIDRLIDGLAVYRALMPAIPSADSIVSIDNEGRVRNFLDRDFLRRVQTPQAFKSGLIREAHERAKKEESFDAGDDCTLVLRYTSTPVFTVPGCRDNIKITFPQDLATARQILEKQKGGNE